MFHKAQCGKLYATKSRNVHNYIQVVHKLESEDIAVRLDMCHNLLEVVGNDNWMHDVLFSDETTFHTLNSHNCSICFNALQEWQQDTPKVDMWMVFRRSKISGPFIFVEKTITGSVYLDILEQFLEPRLRNDGIMDTVVFQEDGASHHFALVARDYLRHAFPGIWIGRPSPRM